MKTYNFQTPAWAVAGILALLPVFAVAAEDIRDIRGPIHIPYPWLPAVYAIAIIGFLIFARWLYRKWKARKRVVIKLPHEIALERLQLALMLMKTGKVREFSIAVSDAVRFYIEDRFQLRAAHKTTEEFLHDILSNPDSPLSVHGPSLEEFLKYCDLAKFAKWSLSVSEMEAMYRSAEKFVNETKSWKEQEKGGRDPSTALRTSRQAATSPTPSLAGGEMK
jgi:hypothetical protein